jgi:hypothetical protein
VEVAEAFVDGLATEADLMAAGEAARAVSEADHAARAARQAAAFWPGMEGSGAVLAAGFVARAVRGRAASPAALAQEQNHLCELLRDVFGNVRLVA